MTTAHSPGRYRNPVLPGCHPDPSICRVGDTFYLVTSSFEYLPGLPIHRSTNLVDWQPVGHAIHRPEQLDLRGIASSKGLYAPTIRYHGGLFHVTCTVVAPPGWAGRTGHFLVTAEDPAGPWSEPVWFDGMPGIDPSLTFDGDRVWLCGNRVAEPGRWPGQTDIWLVELDPASFAPIGPTHWIWHGALEDAGYAEGPHIIAHPDGGWMLVAAEGGTNRDHSVCVAYADEITGPYRGDPGNPRLTHRDLGDRAAIADVGHADLVEDAAGRWWATVLGVQTIGGGNGLLGRQTHLVPMEWERGSPLFAPGTGRVEPLMEAAGVPDQAARPAEVRDGFDTPQLDLAWNGVGRFPDEFAAVGRVRQTGAGESSGGESRGPGAGAGAGVRLAASIDEPTGAQPAFLGRRLPDHRVHIAARMSLDGDVRGGLLLRTSESAVLEVSVDAEGAARVALSGRTVATAKGLPTQECEIVLDVDGLRAAVRVGAVDLGEVDVSALATGGTSMFVGTWTGPFAVGRGHVDVAEVVLRTRG